MTQICSCYQLVLSNEGKVSIEYFEKYMNPAIMRHALIMFVQVPI